MPLPRKFLVIDDNADSRFLLVKTLLRKFPHAVIQECQDGDVAAGLVKTEFLDAVVVHRAAEIDGISLVRMLRRENAKLPIVMVSGIDRSVESRAAGASSFLSYDAWLRIGSVVAEFLSPAEEKSDGLAPPQTSTTSSLPG